MTIDDQRQGGLASVGRAHATDVRGIQHEIGRLWQEAVAAATAARQSATRASVLNLVIYAGNHEDAARACETIGALATRHPSRTIVISPSTDVQAPRVDAQISLYCHLPSAEHRQVCHEEVYIRTSPKDTAHVPGIVQALLIPDLPIFVWSLVEPRPNDNLFSHLTTMAERVIVDSARFSDPARILARLSHLVDQEGERTSFGDVNWRRLTPWRELIAQFFDPLEARLHLLQIDDVAIEARGGARSAQALLLAGWLAGRLNWHAPPRRVAPSATSEESSSASESTESDSAMTRQIRLRRHNAAVNIHISPDRRPFLSSDAEDVKPITSVTLRASASDTTFSIYPGDDPGTVTTLVEQRDSDPRIRVAQFHPPRPAAILSEELNIFGHDRIYEEALGAIKTWERTR